MGEQGSLYRESRTLLPLPGKEFRVSLQDGRRSGRSDVCSKVRMTYLGHCAASVIGHLGS
jgi:hypothetical protein